MDSIESGGKVKRIFWVVIFAVLIIATAALGYLYYTENQDKKNLTETNKELQDRYEEITAGLEGEVSDLSGVSGEKTTLEEENANLKAGMAIIKAYNDVFKHYNSVIETHGGFTGWTDAEFEAGKALAEKTGSTAFVNTVNWAWYETTVPVFDRVLRYQKEIAAGIESGIK